MEPVKEVRRCTLEADADGGATSAEDASVGGRRHAASEVSQRG